VWENVGSGCSEPGGDGIRRFIERWVVYGDLFGDSGFNLMSYSSFDSLVPLKSLFWYPLVILGFSGVGRASLSIDLMQL